MWKMEGKRNCDHIGSSVKAMKSPWMLDIKIFYFFHVCLIICCNIKRKTQP